MSISREKKQAILEKLHRIAADSATIVFVGFSGLPMAQTTAMRKALRGKGVGYFVAKKTLITCALAEAAVHGEKPALPGEVAVAYGEKRTHGASQDSSRAFVRNETKDPMSGQRRYGDDAIVPAQSVREFEGLYAQHISILGGIFAGAYKTKEEMTEIASIPPLPVLRGMFVNVINSPIQGLAVALGAIAQKKAA